MIIRKLFKFEGAHIVRDCSSVRCKESIHGHSYVVEVFLESHTVDNGQMVVDFGLLKTTVRDFLDSFDHAYAMWDRELPDFKKFMKTNSARWVEMPVSPSAEMFALMFYAVIERIINSTIFNNGEGFVELYSVRVHETATGWAEAFHSDFKLLWKYPLESIIFSKGIQDEWKDPNMFTKILNEEEEQFINPVIELKYQSDGKEKPTPKPCRAATDKGAN